MKKCCVYLLLFCAFCICLQAQPKTRGGFRVKGVLIDTLTHEREPYVTVSVYSMQDHHKALKMLMTDEHGEFDFSLADSGTYLLSFTCVGMATVQRKVALCDRTVVDMGVIYTRDDIQNLKGVTVVSRRKLIKVDIDKLEYDVECDPDAAVSNVLDILRKVPFVTVGGLSDVKLKGRGDFKVYINGRPSAVINSQNMAEVLKNMPANTIKSVQVITNPDAKYDAEGVAGILNIVRKKVMPGYSVSLSGGVTNNSQYGRVYSTVQVGKLSISGNASLTRNDARYSYTDNEYVNNQSSDSYKQVSCDNRKMKPSAGTTDDVELSYDIDSLRLFTFGAGIMASRNPVDINGTSKMYTSGGNLASSYDENRRIRNSLNMIVVQSNYQRSFRKKGKMVVLSYQLSALPHRQKTYTDYMNMVNYSFPYTGIFRKENPNTTENTIQLDYTDPITRGQTIEAGVKYIARRNKNNHSYYNRNGDDDYTENAEERLYYRQKQYIYAVYGEYVLKAKKWSAKGGLRYEYTHENMNEAGSTDDHFATHYDNIVPSASLFWDINENNNLKLSYNMRISRPDINFLNPRINSDDPLNIYFGNPAVKCEKNNAWDVEYNYTGDKASISLSSGYSLTDNSIESYTFVTDKVLNHTFRNIGSRSAMWVSLYASGTIYKHLYGSINANWTYNRYRSIPSGGNRSGSCYTVDWNLEQPLPWSISMSVNGSWNNSCVTPQGKTSGTSSYELSLRRLFLDKKLTVSCYADNFLRKYKRYSSWEEGNGFRFQSVNRNEYRFMGISINYRFGKLKKEVPRVAHAINNTDLKKINAN